jgi:uncharacterized DUF497 family protein
LRRHGGSLDEAVTDFYDPLSATFDDEEHSADEARLITVGCSARGRLLVVAHTERGKEELSSHGGRGADLQG